MKRSEMISKIASAIMNHNDRQLIAPRERAIEMAEVILTIQEELGILPPVIVNPRVREESCYNPMASVTWNMVEIADYYRGEIPYKVRINAWEPEE